MRLLVGYLIEIPELLEQRPLPGREGYGDSILAFGGEYRHLEISPSMRWEEILAACPRGWKPDVYLHNSIEYNPVPEGIAEAGCFTAATVGDWNLGGQALAAAGGAFDALLADRPGREMLARQGFETVLPTRIWAQDPGRHRILPGIERDIDVLMLANMNHAIQWERAPWLARVARLATRYRVRIDGGLYGDAYTEIMNRAKIVFNRSIRGELNMRAFEAPACGALHFYEDTNPEVREVFTDRVDCVLYNDSNLEDVLDHYLDPANARELEAIAEAGQRTAARHSYACSFAETVTTLEAAWHRWEEADRPLRAFASLPPTERRVRAATQWLRACNHLHFPRMASLLAECADQPAGEPPGKPSGEPSGEPAGSPLAAALQATVEGEWAVHLSDPAARRTRLTGAITLAQRAARRDPDNLINAANLGLLCLAAGRDAEGGAQLRSLTARLKSGPAAPEQLAGVLFPRGFTRSDVALEAAWTTHLPGSPEWARAMQSVLIARMQGLLAERAYAAGDYPASHDAARASVAEQPDQSELWLALARASRALGRADEALAAYAETARLSPFRVEARQEAARLAMDLGRPVSALALIEEWLAILAGTPFYRASLPRFEALREEARALQAALARPTAPITRLLALPDWSQPADWQEPLRQFASAYGPADPVLLMLRADPAQGVNAAEKLMELQQFLIGTMEIAPNAMPNVTLINARLTADEQWKLLHACDAVIGCAPLPAPWATLAAESRKPFYHPEEIGRLGALVPAA